MCKSYDELTKQNATLAVSLIAVAAMSVVIIFFMWVALEDSDAATKSYRIKYEEKNDRVRVLEDELNDIKMSSTCLFHIPELDK